jgi:hypothetical protein
MEVFEWKDFFGAFIHNPNPKNFLSVSYQHTMNGIMMNDESVTIHLSRLICL